MELGDKVYLSTKSLRSPQPSKKLGPKFLGPFPILKIIHPVTVKLQLPHNLRHIHPVFHCSLLKPFHESAHWHPASPRPAIMVDGEHFEVQEILHARKHHGSLQFLIRWKYFPDHEWVASHHVNAPSLLKKFYDKYPFKPCI